MKNRIDDLIKLGLKDPAAFEAEATRIEKAIKADAKLHEEIREEFKDSLTRKGKEIKDLSIKMQLQEVAEIISLSYIARHYFNKSRQWLNQRVNGFTVSGKPAKFTDSQLETLNVALKDISRKIGSVNVVH